MKILTTILLSLLGGAAAAVVYDQVRTDARPPAETDTADALDRSGLDERLAALEADQHPTLVGTGSSGDARLFERMAEIERRLLALEQTSGSRADLRVLPDRTPVSDRTVEEAPLETMAPGAAQEPAPSEVDRFRMLREAARGEDRRKRAAAQLDRALAKAEIELTVRQREQVSEALAAFESRRNEIWTEAKSRGLESGGEPNWPEVIAATRVTIQSEFTERLSAFLPWQDAEAVSIAVQGAEGK